MHAGIIIQTVSMQVFPRPIKINVYSNRTINKFAVRVPNLTNDTFYYSSQIISISFSIVYGILQIIIIG